MLFHSFFVVLVFTGFLLCESKSQCVYIPLTLVLVLHLCSCISDYGGAKTRGINQVCQHGCGGRGGNKGKPPCYRPAVWCCKQPEQNVYNVRAETKRTHFIRHLQNNAVQVLATFWCASFSLSCGQPLKSRNNVWKKRLNVKFITNKTCSTQIHHPTNGPASSDT